jgi:tRNA(fMet)-specific endonuclease VapC
VRYLLDTSIISETRKVRPNGATLERLLRHGGVSTICAPVWQELLYGCERLPTGKRRTNLEDHLQNIVRQLFPILPYDEAAATWHASERVRLERRGKTAPFVDGQIAAIAAVRGLTVVTTNVEDFKPFEVRVEAW